MRKYFFCAGFIFSQHTAFAQAQLSETERLYTLAKVWGYLKYYHPAVAGGAHNWDEQLYEMIPKADSLSTKQKLSAAFAAWLATLGEVQKCSDCVDGSKSDYFNQNFNLSWTGDTTLLSPEVISKLAWIEKNRFQGTHHYVTTDKHVGNVVITNEPAYSPAQWTSESFRLLMLFKYWNVVEYFYPYKYKIEPTWDDVLLEMIPKFRHVGTELEFHLLLSELTNKLSDSHSFFYTPLTDQFFGPRYIPAAFKIIDGQAVITRLYNDSLALINDLRIGDAILEIDGKPVPEIYEEKKKYINGSNEAVKQGRYAFKAIFNGHSDSVRILFEREGMVGEKTIGRYQWQTLNYTPPATDKWKIIGEDIGYINMGELLEKDLKRTMKQMANTKALIIDIRNYPEFILYDFARYLNSERRQFAKFLKPDLSYPGKFVWTEPLYCGKKNRRAYGGELVLLVDETTQSLAEFTCMCLQTADKATVVGSQTSGADGDVSYFTFFDDYSTMITGLGVFYPDGTETQRIGIVPDVTVQRTVEGIRQGKDEVLEKAIELSKKGNR